MTQILTRSSRRYVLQVTDRQVTAAGKPVDEVANKNVILVTENGVVTMGYTGFAVLGGVPTDQWIAEVLSGKIPRDEERLGVMRPASLRFPDLGRNLDLLRAAVSEVPRSNDVPLKQFGRWWRDPFEICFAGWQWDRKARARPILGHLSKPPEKLEAQISYCERGRLLCGNLAFKPVPSGHLSRDNWKGLYNDMTHASPEATLDLFVRKIREIASASALVGPHCMSILIPRPIFGPIFVKYIPLGASALAQIDTRQGETQIPVAFSPWVIIEKKAFPPSVISGDGWNLDVGAFRIFLEGPASRIGLLSAHRRSPR